MERKLPFSRKPPYNTRFGCFLSDAFYNDNLVGGYGIVLAWLGVGLGRT